MWLFSLLYLEGKDIPNQTDCTKIMLKPCFDARSETNFKVKEGSDIAMDCEVHNINVDLVPISWWRENTLAEISLGNLVTNDRYRVTKSKSNIWTLHIPKVQKQDAGKYICQINSGVLLEKFYHLEVIKNQLKNHIQNDYNSHAYISGMDNTSADIILTGNARVLEGSEMALKCTAIMKFPVPISSSIAWYLNGLLQHTQILNWPHVIISMQWTGNNTLVSVLKISAMHRNYSGTWSCFKINDSSLTNSNNVKTGSSLEITMIPSESAKLNSRMKSNNTNESLTSSNYSSKHIDSNYAWIFLLFIVLKIFI